MTQTWLNQNNRLSKTIVFRSFLEALECMNRIAPIAEAMNHHPDFHLRSYNQLEIEVYTHTSNKIEDKDFVLAEKIDAVLTEFNVK